MEITPQKCSEIHVIHEKSNKISPVPSERTSVASSCVHKNAISTGAPISRTTVSFADKHTSYDADLLTPCNSSSRSWSSEDPKSCKDHHSRATSPLSNNSYLKYRHSDYITNTSLSLIPQSITSYGVTSPTIKTQYSRTTITLLNFAVSPDDTHVIPLLPKRYNGDTTTSSWTVESFTSSGLTFSGSNVVRAKYPWSPKSFVSYTDIYPSSLETLASRKGSRVDLSPGSPSTKNLTPMNYVVLSTNQEENQALDWMIMKRSPFYAKAIDTRVS